MGVPPGNPHIACMAIMCNRIVAITGDMWLYQHITSNQFGHKK